MKELEIQNFNTYKKRYSYKKYYNSIEVNMRSNGFATLFDGEIDPGEKSLDVVNGWIKDMDLDGLVVYRKTTGAWGLPYLFVFYKENLK